MIEFVDNNHGYPWRATCWCGWRSAGYVAVHAAEGMSAAHKAEHEAEAASVQAQRVEALRNRLTS